MKRVQFDRIALKMMEHDAANPHRIQHFLKVHALASLIGRMEGLDDQTMEVLEAAAYVHDIGIKPALQVYGNDSGPYQEKLGMEPARSLLEDCGLDKDQVDRIVYLVGHHHTYENIEGMDYQILVEADFLVNLFEHGSDLDTVRQTRERIFRTQSGKTLLDQMFLKET